MYVRLGWSSPIRLTIVAQPSHRDQLIKGAIQCLKTKGYARTTARDIAAEADANLASIGYHFGSKEALLNEALIQIFKQRNRHIGTVAVASEDASPRGRLTATFRAATDIYDIAPRPLFVAFVEAMAQAERSDELREQMAAHYRDARRGIAETLRANLGDAADLLQGAPEVMASFLQALFDGLVLQWLLDARDIPSGEQLLAALVDLAAVAERESVDQAPRARGRSRRGTLTATRTGGPAGAGRPRRQR